MGVFKIGKKKLITLIASTSLLLAFGGVTVGTTLAAFTDRNELIVTAKTGSISMNTELKIEKAKSLEMNEYVDVSNNEYTFSNTGKAYFKSNGALALENITPGDSLKLKASLFNSSNINIKYRFKTIKVGDISDVVTINYIKNAEKRKVIEKTDIPNKHLEDIEIEVTYPDDADLINDLKGEFVFTFEAIQGNAVTFDEFNAVDNGDSSITLNSIFTYDEGEEVVLENSSSKTEFKYFTVKTESCADNSSISLKYEYFDPTSLYVSDAYEAHGYKLELQENVGNVLSPIDAKRVDLSFYIGKNMTQEDIQFYFGGQLIPFGEDDGSTSGSEEFIGNILNYYPSSGMLVYSNLKTELVNYSNAVQIYTKK